MIMWSRLHSRPHTTRPPRHGRPVLASHTRCAAAILTKRQRIVSSNYWMEKRKSRSMKGHSLILRAGVLPIMPIGEYLLSSQSGKILFGDQIYINPDGYFYLGSMAAVYVVEKRTTLVNAVKSDARRVVVAATVPKTVRATVQVAAVADVVVVSDQFGSHVYQF
jgi:hypothetical protein